MRIHEYGTENAEIILLIHPSLVMWDYFEYVILFLEESYHLMIPALPGYDPDQKGDFSSVEEIAADIEKELSERGIKGVDCVYGCSMGGSIVTRMLVDDRIRIRHAVIDGGITPYQLPWIATRFLAIRDFLMVSMGKIGGIRLIEKAFTSDEYSGDDLRYIADVIKMMSYKTIWRTFESCNNYKMPETVTTGCRHIEYWYADSEEKDRGWDMDHIRKSFPETKFLRFRNVGHGGLAVLHPEIFTREIRRVCDGSPAPDPEIVINDADRGTR